MTPALSHSVSDKELRLKQKWNKKAAWETAPWNVCVGGKILISVFFLSFWASHDIIKSLSSPTKFTGLLESTLRNRD